MKKKVFRNLLSIFFLVIIILCTSEFSRHYEKYNTVARYHFMLDIEKGDTKAIELYQDNYINDDIYLFDGDISFNMFAEKYNISNTKKKNVYDEYKNSELSLNDFVKVYKKTLDK